MSRTLPLGFAAVLSAVLLFGVFPITTKTHATADGVFYQLCMCMGIYTVGAVTFLVQCSTQTTCPQLEPLAALGGAVWCLSNLLLCPLVNAWGVGLTMMAWGMAEMVAGWGTGRWGLFGLSVEAVVNPGENSAAVALALASLCVLGLAVPAVAEGPDKGGEAEAEEGDHVPLLLEEDDSSVSAEGGGRVHPGASAGAADAGEADFLANGHDFVRFLSPTSKRVFGFFGSLCAGLLSGSTFTPLQRMVDENARYAARGGAPSEAPYPGASPHLMDHLFAHFSGIMATSVLFMVIYGVGTSVQPPRCSCCRGGRGRGRAAGPAPRPRGPWLSAPLFLPAFASGVVWGLAMLCWFYANAALSLVVAFPLVTVGPGVVNMLLGCLLFREVVGAWNVALLVTSAVLYTSAAVLIALSGGAG